MPTCRVDHQASPTFSKLLKKLSRDFPHIEEDLVEAFIAIQQDYLHAKHANLIPGVGGAVLKYRQHSRDIRRGARGSFRIIAYYHAPTNTLYPLLVYAKTDREDVPRAEIQNALKEMNDTLGSPESS